MFFKLLLFAVYIRWKKNEDIVLNTTKSPEKILSNLLSETTESASNKDFEYFSSMANKLMVSTWLSKVRVITEKIAATLELVAAACNCFQSSCFENAYRTKSSDN